MTSILCFHLDRFHVAVRLLIQYCNRPHNTSKCSKNTRDKLGYRLVCYFFVSFSQKRNGIVFSSGVNVLHSD